MHTVYNCMLISICIITHTSPFYKLIIMHNTYQFINKYSCPNGGNYYKD